MGLNDSHRRAFAAALGALALATSQAQASVRAGEPPFERALFVGGSCGEGAVLAPAAHGAPSRAALAPGLENTWVLDPVSGGVALRGYASGLYVAAARRREHLVTTTRASEAAVWRLEARGEGRFALAGRRGGYLTLAPGETAARVAPLTGDCSQTFWFDPFLLLTPFQRTLHVDAAASRGGDGSVERPFSTVQAAVAQAEAGDRILLAPGVYRGNVVLEQIGRPDAWIVLQSQFTHAAHIVGTGQTSAIELRGRYLEVHGLRVSNPSTESCIGGNGQNLRVVENAIFDCGGGGVSIYRAGPVMIEGNVVARTAFRNQYQMSGISIWQPRGQAQCPEGWCQIVRRNIAYANDNRVPTFENQPSTDGNGIIIDDFANTQLGSTAGPYPGWALVEHNLTFANGGSGVRVFLSDRVVVRYNTAYRNMRRPGPGWRGDIMNSIGADTRFEFNVAVADREVSEQNAAYFDSGESEVNGRRSRSFWRMNLAGFWPGGDGRSMGVAAGARPAEATLEGLTPVLEAPTLDGLGRFGLVGVRRTDGAMRSASRQFGADPALLPTADDPASP